MKIVMISDTHERHSKVIVPDGDLLIHAGDFTMMGDEEAKKDFFKWFLKLPHEYKVLIAGNHDFGSPTKSEHLDEKAYYLCDSGVTINGFKVWGSPYTPIFGDWAFMYPIPTLRWTEHYPIPEGTDIVVTHGPPNYILDRPFGKGEPVGCYNLWQAVAKVKPKLHVFGHIHGSYGVREFKGTTFVNASICDERYDPTHQPVVIEL